MKATKVLIITGSDSDLSKMQPCSEMLEKLGISSELVVASAHRNPDKVKAAVNDAGEAGAQIIIAAAGMSAALPGAVAALTDLPVVGVPLDSGMPGGIDALFSIVQMPTGIPVAAVAVNGAKNAAVLAARILALQDPDVREALAAYRKELAEGGSK
jgi:5-(carboxyamino)imidazole ribonucleotide mutase